jgi:hypothetical protein
LVIDARANAPISLVDLVHVAEPGEAGQLLQPKGRAIAKHEK